jgi:tetratricopeptide (TPR) repeat protein
MEEEPLDEDAKALRERKAQAQKEKDAGNAAYKARQFEQAIQHYHHAIELDDSDISFLTNRQESSPSIPKVCTAQLRSILPLFPAQQNLIRGNLMPMP